MAQVEANKTYVGVVEDNEDPKKLGRVKIRVLDVYDDLDVEDIPYASPWKDLNGNEFNVPEKGKVVTVIFDQANIYKPEFIYSEHFNVNLENKLSKLEGKDYTSMKSLIFDHKTQIFVNDKDKLVIDYKMSQINITEGGINMNLKDNNGSVNIGSANANQQAILGTNFLEWFDEFVDNLLNGPYLGNLMVPVVANPSFIDVLTKYKTLKDPKFLSKNVNLNDNGYINADIIGIQKDREMDGQIGDSWKSTIKKNELVLKDPIDFTPKASTPLEGNLTTSSGDTSGGPNQPLSEPSPSSIPPASTEVSDSGLAILNALKSKGYIIYDRPYEMNIIGVRYQYPGQVYSNKFVDRLYLVYKNDDGAVKDVWYPITTLPGKYGSKSESQVNGKYTILFKDVKKIKDRGGIGILKPAQYVDSWIIGEHLGEKALRPGVEKFYRDNTSSETINFSKEGSGNAGMLIHKAFSRAQGKNTYGVFNWSEGCNVIPDPAHLDQFFELLERHRSKYGNKFTYTLITSKDVEDAQK